MYLYTSRNAFETVLCYTVAVSFERKVESINAISKGTATEMKTRITNNDTSLHGWLLAVARILVFMAMAATVGLFVLALPDSLNYLAMPCANSVNQCLMVSAQIAPLASLGITPHALALAAIALSCLALFLAE